MKRLLVLLVLLAAGVVAAALAIPTNAATVNGSAISQQSLNSDVRAIAGSVEYQCYLNAEEYLSSSGSSTLPPVDGAGASLNPGHPTATSAFVASYLDTEIGHRLLLQVAARRGVAVTQAQLAQARVSLSEQITSVMEEVAQTGSTALTCGVSGAPLTGPEVLATMPSWFVDNQVQFIATASALEEDLAGVGTGEADLQRYYAAHRSEFDTVCLSAAAYPSQEAAEAGFAAVAFGTPFSQVASQASQSGALGCQILADFATGLGTSIATLEPLAVGQVSTPIETSSGWILVSPTQRTGTPYRQASQSVASAVQRAGAAATQRVLTAAERRSSVEVNPQYGIWVSGVATVFTPLTPQPADVLNAAANEPGGTTASTGPTSG